MADAFIKFDDIKFDGLGGQGQKLGNDFDRLGDGFSDLGDAFIKLVDEVTSAEFVKKHLANVKFELVAIGDDFNKIGQDFVKLADSSHKFDDAVIKFTEQFIKFTPSDGEPSFPLANDFLKFEGDVRQTGLDFLGAASDIKTDAPTESISLTFHKISQDYEAQSADALSIKGHIADFLDIGGISDSSELGMAFFKYSADWQKISDAYLQLGADFQKISNDFLPTEANRKVKLSQIVLDHTADFVQLSQDLKVADAALSGLGGDFHKLADALENAGPSTTPTFKLG
jgi:hypothetical protein